MKIKSIFSIVPDCHAQAGHYTGLWQKHFYDGLANVVERLFTPAELDFSWARQPIDGATKGRRAQTSEKLFNQIVQASQKPGIDLVLSYCFSQDLERELVARTIHMGIPWVNFFCDSLHRFAEVEELARVASLNWFPEHAAIPAYRVLGRPWICQPYALNPACLPDLSCRQPAHDAGFVGLPTANRITQLGLLYLRGCPVAVRGPGWKSKTTHPFCSPVRLQKRLRQALLQPGLGEKVLRRLLWPLVRKHAGEDLNEAEFQKFVQDSRILLGLNQGRLPDGRFMSYLKFRDVEFPGYGCCYLTGHNDDVAQAFDIGREILSYDNMTEAAGKIAYYRTNPQESQRVGIAGRKRVLRSHTWAARLRQLQEVL